MRGEEIGKRLIGLERSQVIADLEEQGSVGKGGMGDADRLLRNRRNRHDFEGHAADSFWASTSSGLLSQAYLLRRPCSLFPLTSPPVSELVSIYAHCFC
jgi:hypothetical protein